MGLFVCSRVVHIVLRLLQCILLVHNLRLSGHSFRIWIFAVWAHVHVVVVIFLFQRWPSFLTDEGICLFTFCVLFEECLARWRLLLAIVIADIATDVFRLIEVLFLILQFAGLLGCCWAHLIL